VINLCGKVHVNETLIKQARRGDEAAWAQLVAEHQEAVFRLAYLLLGEAAEAQDVAQETFIRAFQALARFDTTRSLRPWLLSITTNLARNRRRAIGRYLAAVGRFFKTEPEPTLPPPSEMQLQRWEAETLRQAVQRLSRSDQEIIYLRYFLQLSVTETAEAAGIASGTVKSRLHRDLNRLRAVIEAEFPALQEERV
jgi:RNA polymerase sigma-70 factor (ECF subfamily)